MTRKNLLANVIRYFHTVKYLKPIQIYGQLRSRLPKKKIGRAEKPKRRAPSSMISQPIFRDAQLHLPTKLEFLHEVHEITEASIWQHPQLEKLWRYNLHYFDFLHAKNGEDQIDWQHAFILRWIKENPNAIGDGWEPYPVSLRLVNWIKWLLKNNISSDVIDTSIAAQAHHLYHNIETHLLANHLFANAKALLVAGLFFSHKQANKWFRKGMHLFNREQTEQILSDGGHFELSTMYHAIILEDLLDAVNLFRAYGKSIPQVWFSNIDKMFHWLETMSHLDRDIAFFNDATLGIAPTLPLLWDYRDRLELQKCYPLPNQAITHLETSGYCRIQADNAVLLADIGHIGASYQPGHAHADTLSFEFSIGQQRLFVNSGISTYADCPKRYQERGTSAHNTLEINATNSSEVWKSFRVARRAKVQDIHVSKLPNGGYLAATHTGYWTKFCVKHTRKWLMSEGELTIEDVLAGKGTHDITWYLHCDPALKILQENENKIVCYDSSNQFIASVEADFAIKIVDSSYHPGFNLSLPNKKLVIARNSQLPMELKVTIKWTR